MAASDGADLGFNIEDLKCIGPFTYQEVEHVLRLVKTPAQLRLIELNSPQILGEDSELWLAFIRRKIPGWSSKRITPDAPDQWYELYQSLYEQDRRDVARQGEALRETFRALEAKKAARMCHYVDPLSLPGIAKHTRLGKPARRTSGAASAPIHVPVSASASAPPSQANKPARTKAQRALDGLRKEVSTRDLWADRRRAEEKVAQEEAKKKKAAAAAAKKARPSAAAAAAVATVRPSKPTTAKFNHLWAAQFARPATAAAGAADSNKAKTLKRKATDDEPAAREQKTGPTIRVVKVPRRRL